MLRQRAHNLTLPSDVSLTSKQNFIPRMLFADMYTEQYYERMYELYYWTLLKFISHVSMCVFLSRVTQVRLSFVHYRFTYLLIYQ